VRAAAGRLGDAGLDNVLRELEDVSKQLAQLVAPPPPVIVIDGTLHATPGLAVGSTATAAPMPATAPAPVERKLRRMQEKASSTVSGEHCARCP
jgi:hypothetical protein